MKQKITELAENAPTELINEVRASHDMSVEEAAWHCVEDYMEGWVVEFDGKVAGITGTTNLDWDTGCPWLLTTTVAASSPRAFLRLSKALVERWAKIYTLQINYIDSQYHQALTWARHVGFQVSHEEPFGPFNLPFCKIEYRRT